MSLDALGIVSKDIKKSIRFYGMLGVFFKQTDSSEHWEGTTSNGMRIMLDSVKLIKTIYPSWEAPKGSAVALCFKQDSPEKVNELYVKITEAGFKGLKAPWDAFWGQRYSSVLDPDGNQIDIFSPC